MRTIGFRFSASRFAAGATLLSIGSGAASITPRLILPGAILFFAGIVITLASVLTLRPRPVILYDTWDHHRVYRALEKAPDDAVVRIQQTWFPEEDFVAKLQDLLLRGKQYDLQVMLVDPGLDEGSPAELVAARVLLRDLSAMRGGEEVRSTISSLARMKEAIDAKRRDTAIRGRRPSLVNLEIRLYQFLPFGPIYQVAEDVMFVGIFLNFATSAEGPMIEVRNTPGNRLWRILEHHFDQGWASPSSVIAYPAEGGHQAVHV
jgi:hypothetical protein